MNQVGNKTTCIEMNLNVDSNGAFKIDSFILFQVVLINFCSDSVQIFNPQNFSPL